MFPTTTTHRAEGLDATYVNPSMLFDEEEYQAVVREGHYWLEQAQLARTDVEEMRRMLLEDEHKPVEQAACTRSKTHLGGSSRRSQAVEDVLAGKDRGEDAV